MFRNLCLDVGWVDVIPSEQWSLLLEAAWLVILHHSEL